MKRWFATVLGAVLCSGVALAAECSSCEVSLSPGRVENQLSLIRSNMVSIAENLVYLDGRLRQLSDAHKGQILAAMGDQTAHLVAIQTQFLEASDKNAQDAREVMLQAIHDSAQALYVVAGLTVFMLLLCLLIGASLWLRQRQRYQVFPVTTPEPVRAAAPAARVPVSEDAASTVAISPDQVDKSDEEFASVAEPPQDAAIPTVSVPFASVLEAPSLDTTIGIDEAAYQERVSGRLTADQKSFMRQDFFQNTRPTSWLKPQTLMPEPTRGSERGR